MDPLALPQALPGTPLELLHTVKDSLETSSVEAQFRQRLAALDECIAPPLDHRPCEWGPDGACSSKVSELAKHLDAVATEKKELLACRESMQAEIAALKDDLDKERDSHKLAADELAVAMAERTSDRRRFKALETHVLSLVEEKQRLKADLEAVQARLQAAKQHYKKHDSERQRFVEQKCAEMKSVKKEHMTNSALQRDTQKLLLAQIAENRAAKQSQRKMTEKVNGMSETIDKLHHAQQLQSQLIESQELELNQERSALAAVRAALQAQQEKAASDLDLAKRMKEMAEADARAALLDYSTAADAMRIAQEHRNELQERCEKLQEEVDQLRGAATAKACMQEQNAKEARSVERERRRERHVIDGLGEKISDLMMVLRRLQDAAENMHERQHRQLLWMRKRDGARDMERQEWQMTGHLQLQRLQDEVKDLTKELVRVEEDRRQEKQRADKEHRALALERETSSMHESALRAAQANIGSLSSDVMELKAQVQHSQGQATTFAAQAAADREKLEKEREVSTFLRQKCEDLNKNTILKDWRHSLASLTCQLNQALDQLIWESKDLQREAAHVQHEVDECAELEIKHLMRDRDHALEKLVQEQAVRGKLEADYDTLEARLRKAHKSLTEVQHATALSLQALRSQLGNAESTERALERSCQDLRLRTAEAEARIETLMAENQEIQGQYAALQLHCGQLQQQCKTSWETSMKCNKLRNELALQRQDHESCLKMANQSLLRAEHRIQHLQQALYQEREAGFCLSAHSAGHIGERFEEGGKSFPKSQGSHNPPGICPAASCTDNTTSSKCLVQHGLIANVRCGRCPKLLNELTQGLQQIVLEVAELHELQLEVIHDVSDVEVEREALLQEAEAGENVRIALLSQLQAFQQRRMGPEQSQNLLGCGCCQLQSERQTQNTQIEGHDSPEQAFASQATVVLRLLQNARRKLLAFKDNEVLDRGGEDLFTHKSEEDVRPASFKDVIEEVEMLLTLVDARERERHGLAEELKQASACVQYCQVTESDRADADKIRIETERKEQTQQMEKRQWLFERDQEAERKLAALQEKLDVALIQMNEALEREKVARGEARDEKKKMQIELEMAWKAGQAREAELMTELNLVAMENKAVRADMNQSQTVRALLKEQVQEGERERARLDYQACSILLAFCFFRFMFWIYATCILLSACVQSAMTTLAFDPVLQRLCTQSHV